jgi:hypothetical protein
MKKLKGFNHQGWGIAFFLSIIIMAVMIGAVILNSMANTPSIQNLTCNQCEPGMNPWVFQHPLIFLEIFGAIALAVGLITIITFMLKTGSPAKRFME